MAATTATAARRTRGRRRARRTPGPARRTRGRAIREQRRQLGFLFGHLWRFWLFGLFWLRVLGLVVVGVLEPLGETETGDDSGGHGGNRGPGSGSSAAAAARARPAAAPTTRRPRARAGAAAAGGSGGGGRLHLVGQRLDQRRLDLRRLGLLRPAAAALRARRLGPSAALGLLRQRLGLLGRRLGLLGRRLGLLGRRLGLLGRLRLVRRLEWRLGLVRRVGRRPRRPWRRRRPRRYAHSGRRAPPRYGEQRLRQTCPPGVGARSIGSASETITNERLRLARSRGEVAKVRWTNLSDFTPASRARKPIMTARVMR